jgi:protein phosphatase methylesterase 1
MSDMARSFARAKLSVLPPEAPLLEEPDDEQYSSASSVSSTGTVRPASWKPASASKPGNAESSTPSVPAWSEFFQQELFLNYETELIKAQYHAYVVEPESKQQPIIILHHGAGSSAMTFALFVRELRKLMPKAGILAVDARDHGETTVRDAKTGDIDTDMSVTALADDLVNMVNLAAEKMKWYKVSGTGEKELPSMFVIGHSLGGAVVTHVASSAALGRKSFVGFAVIDAVEGYAVEALKHMRAYLATKPRYFDSIDAAIDWHFKTKLIRNMDSARVSVPSLFVSDPANPGKWLWRTDLNRTPEYWNNWFSGMSKKFLTGVGAKVLILAGTDRLDKELTIGQMQGMSRY